MSGGVKPVHNRVVTYGLLNSFEHCSKYAIKQACMKRIVIIIFVVEPLYYFGWKKVLG